MQKCFTQRGFVVTTTVQPCPPAHKLVRIWMCNRDGGDYWMGRQLPKTFSFLSVLLSSLIVFSRIPACACWSMLSPVWLVWFLQPSHQNEWPAFYIPQNHRAYVQTHVVIAQRSHYMYCLWADCYGWSWWWWWCDSWLLPTWILKFSRTHSSGPHIGLKDDIGMVSSLFARSEEQAGQKPAKGSRMN